MAAKKTTTEEKNKATYVAPTYAPSTSVQNAQDLLNQHLGKKPGEYQSKWQSQLDAQVNAILNREKFDYDLNADALFQQYKDNYTRQGQLAMMDTMGQAAALTGGYGNSYAQNVGQQAYQGYLQQLNDKVPEFYQMAQNQYNLEGQQMMDNATLLAQQEAMDRELYESAYSKWLSDRDYLSGRYDSERNYDYGMYTDNRDFAYQQERDRVADEQWQKQYDLSKKKSASSGVKKQNKVPTYGSIVDVCRESIRNGANKSKVSAYLRSAYENGYISEPEWRDLKAQFVPSGGTTY